VMRGDWRRTLLLLGMLGALVLAAVAASLSMSWPVASGTVRAGAADIPRMRSRAAMRATDGIESVAEGACRHSVPACLDLVGTIGYQMWHALEVLADRVLATAAAVFQLYAPEAQPRTPLRQRAPRLSRIRHEVGSGVTLVSTRVDGQHD
jgi:hypothetical protein